MTRRDEARRYWFPAKRYGWGWGLPITWQGWLVLVGYAGLALALFRWVSPREYPWLFVAGMAVLSLALCVVCWWTGEPPRWRWGDEKK